MEQGSIERAADAAYQRGLIAEDEVRWGDAADHFARAARLAPDFDRLFKAREHSPGVPGSIPAPAPSAPT